jgi:eukaryotic-like serine/threonine-protein kinase
VYEIVALIGAGGMGEVYRARDTTLHREVAIKILPPAFAIDTERVARFKREAQVLASVNHPNIAAIYGLVEAGDVDALVLEFVDGPTLADRIAHGPLPLDEALAIARQIADALECAHEQGIVHRDLKPANIKVREDGTVKVLDFGLAKMAERPDGRGSHDRSTTQSPTITTPAVTAAGIILGTAAYMSPEQAKGKPADNRSDIWAFGCVLYEMLTGKRAFDGDDVADTLAAILRSEPDWNALPMSTPPALRRLLRRCIERDRRKRLANIADARLELDDTVTSGGSPHPVSQRSRLAERSAFVALVALLALVTLRSYTRRTETPAAAPFNLSVNLPGDSVFASTSVPAVSPDGRSIAFVASTQGRRQIWVRRLDGPNAYPLAGTDGASYPFWSPDSRSLAFFTEGVLKRINTDSGTPVTLVDPAGGRPGIGVVARGGTWGSQDVIVFAPNPTSGLLRVSASGGRVETLTRLDGTGEVSHRWPAFLPDGEHFVYASSDGAETTVYVGSLSSSDRNAVLTGASNAMYAGPGYLLYARHRALFAQAFDSARLQARGDPILIAEDVDFTTDDVTGSDLSMFSASQTPPEVVAFTSGRLQASSQLAWFDRAGRQLSSIGPIGDLRWPRISPDGTTVVFARANAQTGFYELWLHDLRSGGERRLTMVATTTVGYPIWSRDSSRVVFTSTRDRLWSLFVQPISGGAHDEVLLANARGLPMDWSPDGRYVIYQTGGGPTSFDVWMLPLDGERKPLPYLNSAAGERQPRVSPNGRWIAYVSDETRRPEIYVQTFPQPGGKWAVSSSGGMVPVWRSDGSELFFVSPDGRLTAVPISSGPSFEPGPPRPLFQWPTSWNGVPWFDVGADGRFLIPIAVSDAHRDVPISVNVNWTARLKANGRSSSASPQR